MDYYIVYQDKRIINFAEPTGALKQSQTMDEMPIQFYIKEKNENEYLDYIEKPVVLVSDKLKKILEKFQSDTFFKPAVLADVKRMKQDLYWIIVPELINCISSKSEFNKNGTLKRLVIDENKIGFNKFFKIEGILEEIIVISLDLAESILRRDFNGIKLKKIEKALKG